MPTKKLRYLLDCHDHDAGSEIFVVEGKSAQHAIGQVRSKRTQAVLCMQGKIPNVARVSAERVHANVHCQSLFDSLGSGTGSSCNPERLRYGRIWLVSDGDIDGLHTRALLLALFERYLHPLIEHHRVGVIHAPRYRINPAGDESVLYLQNDEEKRRHMNNHSLDDTGTITTFKGIASLTRDELHDLVLNPATRHGSIVTSDAPKIHTWQIHQTRQPNRDS